MSTLTVFAAFLVFWTGLCQSSKVFDLSNKSFDGMRPHRSTVYRRFGRQSMAEHRCSAFLLRLKSSSAIDGSAAQLDDDLVWAFFERDTPLPAICTMRHMHFMLDVTTSALAEFACVLFKAGMATENLLLV